MLLLFQAKQAVPKAQHRSPIGESQSRSNSPTPKPSTSSNTPVGPYHQRQRHLYNRSSSSSAVLQQPPLPQQKQPPKQGQIQNPPRNDQASSSSKRNSNPVQLSPSKSNTSNNAYSPKRNSSPHLSQLPNFQVVTIRESLENNNVSNTNRFKGSPVTALKDEIDRRFSTGGGMGTIDSGLGWGIGDEVDSIHRQLSSPIQHIYDNEDQVSSGYIS